MLNLILSTGQISALAVISFELENTNDFKSAAIDLRSLAENIEFIAMANHLKIICHMLNKEDITEKEFGQISLKLLLKD